MRKFTLLFVISLTLLCGRIRGQTASLPFNFQWANGPGSAHAYKIATLVPASAGTYDHLHLVATLNTGDYSWGNSTIDATFGNREMFLASYTVRGASQQAAHLAAYAQSDGSVDIYMMLGSWYVAGSYTVLENIQEQVYQSPVDLGNTTPPGTLVWDSNNAAATQHFVGFNGNQGIGTQTPGGELSVVTPNPASETGAHIINTSPDGYAVVRLGTDSIAASGSAWHQFNSQWSGDPNSAYAPLTTNLTAFESGGLGLTTYVAAPIKFFTSGTAPGNERMRIDPAGNVGIGTATPAAKLDVNGMIKATGMTFPDGSSQTSAYPGAQGTLTLANAQLAHLSVESDAASGGGYGAAISLHGNLHNWDFVDWNSGNGGVFPGSLGITDASGVKQLFDPSGNIYIGVRAGDGSITSSTMSVLNSGNVGIGTTTPVSPLEVHGNVTVSGTGAGIYFPGNSTPQTVPWTGSLYGQDYADSVDVSGDRKQYEPGDVLVIDPTSTRHFIKSSHPYSTLAAGVYSTKPGVVGRRSTDRSFESTEVPLAMVGIVPTKVTTENGPIRAGDLLVTSSLPGYAMKGTDREQLTGAVLGKALQALPVGEGIVDVLISLQ